VKFIALGNQGEEVLRLFGALFDVANIIGVEELERNRACVTSATTQIALRRESELFPARNVRRERLHYSWKLVPQEGSLMQTLGTPFFLRSVPINSVRRLDFSAVTL